MSSLFPHLWQVGLGHVTQHDECEQHDDDQGESWCVWLYTDPETEPGQSNEEQAGKIQL